jgi:hypothetical protein
MVTLLDGFCSRVDPNSFSTLTLSFSSPLARCENYTPDDSDLYHVLLGGTVSRRIIFVLFVFWLPVAKSFHQKRK